MDKVKPYLLLLKKHHFWLLAVVILGISVYAWYSGTAAYDAAFVANKGQIAGTFSQVQIVNASQSPPNGSYAEALKAFRDKQSLSTLQAWQTLYDRQKDLLTWPEWAKDIATAKPAEASAEGEPAPNQFHDSRQNYLNSFPKYFAQLFSIVKPLEVVSTPVAAAGNGQQQKKVEQKTIGIVDWPVSDRDALVEKYAWKKTPTITQVRIAQENYWLYRVLFEIIAKTNESAGATDIYNAAIKKIETIAIAQEALAAPKSTLEALPPEILAAASNDAAGQIKPPTVDSTDAELVANRYVDPQGAPIAAETPGSEFKLIPVWMRFRMDQRTIPNLLVACANSAIPVEVRQVLYNPTASGSRGGRPGNNNAAVEAKGADSYYDCMLDLRGVIYLFNPPNKESLGLVDPAAEGQPGAEGEAPTEPAAESTPAGEQPAADGTQPGTPADGEAAPGSEPTAAPAAETPAATVDSAAPSATDSAPETPDSGAAPATETPEPSPTPPADAGAPAENEPAAPGK